MSRGLLAGLAAVVLLALLAGVATGQGWSRSRHAWRYDWSPGPSWGYGPGWGWEPPPPYWGWTTIYIPPPVVIVVPGRPPRPRSKPDPGPELSGLDLWPGRINPWPRNQHISPPFVQLPGRIPGTVRY